MTTTVPFAAIETYHHGYRFRSRLEGRWAVFFEQLGIAFEYECEGFILSTGQHYLPDFYLPQVRMWAEVKPTFLDEEARTKCRLLSEGSELNCLHLVGPPDFKTYVGTTWNCHAWTETDYLLDIDYHKRRYYNNEHRLWSSTAGEFSDPDHFTVEYMSAVFASRGARFGEL